MKESIGSTASFNIVIAFIAIVFAFLAASLSYYKAYKVNNVITNSILKYEGFNDLSKSEINAKLAGIGYQRYGTNCGDTKSFNGVDFSKVDDGDGFCIYFNNNSTSHSYQYGIVTYMTINIPIIGEFLKIPVNTVSKEIYGCYGNNSSYGSYNCD